MNQLLAPTWDPIAEFAARGVAWLVLGVLVIVVAHMWRRHARQDHSDWPHVMMWLAGAWAMLNGLDALLSPHLVGMGL